MAKHDVSKEELDGLLPSERAAIEDGNDGEDTAAEATDTGTDASTDAGKGGEDGGEAGDAGKGADTEAASAAEAEAKAKAEAEAKAAADAAAAAAAAPDAGKTTAAAADDDEFVETPISKLIEADEEYQAAVKELAQKFEDGNEMSTGEYTLATQKLHNEATDRAIDKQNWRRTCHEFFQEHPEVSAKKSQALYDAFDQRVIRLAGDDANASKSMRWFLNTAFAQLQEEIPGLKGAPAAPRPGVKDLKQRTERTGIPTSLAHVPAADAADTGEDEFDALDRLQGKDPLAYERELAKLSEEKAQRYLERV